jgi:uncharacterized protein DUF4232
MFVAGVPWLRPLLLHLPRKLGRRSLVSAARIVKLFALAAVGIALAGCGGGKTVTVTQTVTRVRTVTVRAATTATTPSAVAECRANNLRGSFDHIRFSEGAGNTSYRLTVTNIGSSPCFVFGVPDVQLLAATGSPLPTHVSAAQAGTALAVPVTLQHGDSTTADARFSPDVPGVGDKAPGQCQPTATMLQVTVGAATGFDVPIKPPTPVCEQGSLSSSLFAAHAPRRCRPARSASRWTRHK